ncbi:MAG: hypothetical protein FJ303_09480 [Planctomycetes bacterium]|nr:hypothetical protein [Planctomycetota bacterium]
MRIPKFWILSGAALLVMVFLAVLSYYSFWEFDWLEYVTAAVTSSYLLVVLLVSIADTGGPRSGGDPPADEPWWANLRRISYEHFFTIVAAVIGMVVLAFVDQVHHVLFQLPRPFLDFPISLLMYAFVFGLLVAYGYVVVRVVPHFRTMNRRPRSATMRRRGRRRPTMRTANSAISGSI